MAQSGNGKNGVGKVDGNMRKLANKLKELLAADKLDLASLVLKYRKLAGMASAATIAQLIDNDALYDRLLELVNSDKAKRMTGGRVRSGA